MSTPTATKPAERSPVEVTRTRGPRLSDAPLHRGDTLGQILKDFEVYEPSDAGTMIWLLGKLGYEPAFDFMTREYRQLEALARSTKEPEPTVPHHYMASLYGGGSGGIYVSLDKAAARQVSAWVCGNSQS